MYVLPLCLFNVNRFLLVREEGTFPSVVFGLCAVASVVLVRGNGLDFRLLGLVVTNSLYGMIVDELAFAYFVTDGSVYITLLLQGIFVPEAQTVALIPLYNTVTVKHKPKKIKRSHKLYISVYYADSYIYIL